MINLLVLIFQQQINAVSLLNSCVVAYLLLWSWSVIYFSISLIFVLVLVVWIAVTFLINSSYSVFLTTSFFTRCRGWNKRNLHCRLKLWVNAKRAGWSGGALWAAHSGGIRGQSPLQKFLGSKMPPILPLQIVAT